MDKHIVLNDKGEPIILNAKEKLRAAILQETYNREYRNALGFEIPITTLFSISKKVLEQKFFELAPADYMPLRVGENAWSTEILTFRDYALAGDFETGLLNTAANNSRLAEADTGVDSVTNKVKTWGKEIIWSFPELQFAARAGNWDIVTSKERSRKKNWDLGIQRVAFLGLAGDNAVMGLLNQANVNSNTALIAQYISTMDAATFQTFVAGVVGAYRTNSVFTAMPNKFVVPELDYNGLVAPVSSAFPLVNKLSYLLDAFKVITRNPNFEILPCAYAGQLQNVGVNNLNGKNRYALYNDDEDSMRMDLPVDYTNTMQNSLNNFQFQNVGFGQFTGLLAYRPLEMLYFDWNS